MRLVAVIVKKSRLNGERHKVQGGVLNPDAVHGKGYYTRRIVGQDYQQVRQQLNEIIFTQKKMLWEEITGHGVHAQAVSAARE